MNQTPPPPTSANIPVIEHDGTTAAQHALPPEALIESGSIAAILTVTAITLAAISSAPVTGVLITAIGIITALLPVFYPDETWEPITNNLARMIPDLIDEKLLQKAINDANTERAIHLTRYQNILTTLDTWKRDRMNGQILISKYSELTDELVANMLKLAPEKYRGVLLPQYAAVAYAHIPVLCAFYPYANELGLNSRAYPDAQSMVAAQLRKDIALFINTAVTSYRSGLKNLILNSENTSSAKRPTWDEYSQYRTKMRLLALDQIAQLVYWDPQLYPSGCNLKFKNRALYSFFDTYHDSNAARTHRGNILEFENKHVKLLPIYKAHTLNLSSARLIPDGQNYYLIDGLFSTKCLSYSIDGFHTAYLSPVTGESVPRDPRNIVLHTTAPIPMHAGCFCLHGSYWNGDIRAPGGNFWLERNYTHTIRDMSLIFDVGQNHNAYTKLRFYSAYGETEVFNRYIQSLPAIDTIPSPIRPSDFSSRLADFSIIVDQQKQVHSYLITWRDLAATQDLLPKQAHGNDPASTPVEQFHAIKAATSIQQQQLKLIAGPGFTGGDLVALGPKKHLKFQLQRDPARWFNGKYRVRLWVVHPRNPVDVQIVLYPGNEFANSVLDARVSAAEGAPPDLEALKFEELTYIPFFSWIIISNNMRQISLELHNHSSDTELVVDRIELLFESVATA